MSGCIHKNRMCVIYMCRIPWKLSCKFYDEMSKICMRCFNIFGWLYGRFVNNFSDPVHCSRRIYYVYRSIIQSLKYSSHTQFTGYMRWVYVSYFGFDNKKVVISFGFGRSHTHSLTYTHSHNEVCNHFSFISVSLSFLYQATMFQHNIAVFNVIPSCLTK